MRVHAHRGFRGVNPENTVGALRAASERADAVEVDVRLTGDGDPVVFHDARLDDLTDASGRVDETATETVCAARVLGTDERVPRLREAVAAVPDDAALLVELKGTSEPDPTLGRALAGDERERARERWAPVAEATLDVCDDAPNSVVYQSFYEGGIAALRARSTAPVATLAWADVEAARERADRYDARAVHLPWNLVPGTPFAGTPYAQGDPDVAASMGVDPVEVDAPPAGLVERIHERGREVWVWTVETWWRAARLREADVDAVTVDYPGVTGW